MVKLILNSETWRKKFAVYNSDSELLYTSLEFFDCIDFIDNSIFKGLGFYEDYSIKIYA